MRKLKLMSIIGAAALALVMVVSATGCGDDASSVNRKSNSSSSKSDSKDKNKDSSSKSKDDSKKQDDGDDDNDDGSSAESKSDNGSSGESKSDNSKSDDSNNSDDATMSQEEWEEFQKSDEHKEFIDEQKAGQNAIAGAEDQIGEGDWRIVSTEKSKSPGDGFDCWKIGVVNYADSQSPTYYFYCGDQFCILEQ